jgi:hypothetical protein
MELKSNEKLVGQPYPLLQAMFNNDNPTIIKNDTLDFILNFFNLFLNGY